MGATHYIEAQSRIQAVQLVKQGKVATLGMPYHGRSPVGQVFLAIRENPLRCRFLGYSVRGYALTAFTVSVAVAGAGRRFLKGPKAPGAMAARTTPTLGPVPAFLHHPPGASHRDDNAPPLEARGLAKRLGYVQAVDGVDLTLAFGELKAIIGPNGAG
ncbi:MAG: hypothetical protein ACFCBW_01020 [Candidatus Competibacterales bacterium]